ncbi:hypothetical protein [Nostoc sp.]|uniref:hypothetical protein n=1 Tax=Nostoc sp. TaxID=1180 RepID=UPI002FF68A05
MRCPSLRDAARTAQAQGKTCGGRDAIALLTSVIAPATNEAIAYSTQKVMILSSDSSSLMLFFPRLNQERCRTTSLRDAPRTWKQATRSVSKSWRQATLLILFFLSTRR